MTKHTILFLAANPGGNDRLALDQEARAIQVELERSGYRDCFELETRWAAEPLDLLRELRKLKPTVVHFSGHGRQKAGSEQQPEQTLRLDVLTGNPGLHGGEMESGLLFHGADGRAQVVSTAALKQTIEAAGASVKLVVLSACYSAAHAAALLAHVDCVVGMSGSIPDDTARSFAIGFYGGLGERESVATAYKQGCAAISLQGLRDADQPQLKVRDGVDARELVLAEPVEATDTTSLRSDGGSASPMVSAGAPPASATVVRAAAAGTASPKVDIGILTIREDEFRAVLGVFPDTAGMITGTTREYTLRRAGAGNGEHYTIAVLRQVEQGNGEAQDAARDLIEDLAPKLLLVVGIAGGLPSEDVKLGDVILSTRIHDFTVEARKTGEDPTYAVAGGPVSKGLAARVTNLAGRETELGDWTADLPPPPPVAWVAEGELYGPQDWQRELQNQLEHHYGTSATPRAPVYVAGAIASSDRLVKDPALLFPWITTAHNLLAVEMESGGVYRAARERCPMLTIRGISDIVGLKRADAWTKFACASAAAFTRAFLRTRPVPVGGLDDARSIVRDEHPSSARGPAPHAWRRRLLLSMAAMSLLLASSLVVSAGARRTACRVPGLRSLCAAVGIGDVPTPAEQALWDDALAQDSCEGLRAYLNSYPRGVYRDEARSRLDGRWFEEKLGVARVDRYKLVINQKGPFPTEEKARQDAKKRGDEEAPDDCKPPGGTHVLQLVSAWAEPREWSCSEDERTHTFTCGFDGWVVCQVRDRIKSEHCGPQGERGQRVPAAQ